MATRAIHLTQNKLGHVPSFYGALSDLEERPHTAKQVDAAAQIADCAAGRSPQSIPKLPTPSRAYNLLYLWVYYTIDFAELLVSVELRPFIHIRMSKSIDELSEAVSRPKGVNMTHSCVLAVNIWDKSTLVCVIQLLAASKNEIAISTLKIE